MRIQVFNANSLAGKAEEIKRLARECNIDIAITVETWLGDSASPPIRPYLVNITQSHTHIIAGGKRNWGGILVNVFKEEYKGVTRVLKVTPEKDAVVLDVNGVIVIGAYLPPSAEDTCLDRLLATAEEFAEEGRKPCVILGDLNARSEALTGDHFSNQRGKRLEGLLDESTFVVQQPIKGKWTSFNQGGFGIPDLVIANFPVEEMVVHEANTCGGSDHRPITISVPNKRPRYKHFARWNVRRLAKGHVEKRYLEALKSTGELAQWEAKCKEVTQQVCTGAQEVEGMQNRVDTLWKELVGVIHRAADHTVGKLEFDNRTPQGFWTQELEDEREAVMEEQAAFQEEALAGNSSRVTLRNRAKSVANQQRWYRAKLSDRKTEMFRATVDKLGRPSNTAAFMKMVKGARKRHSGGGCALDPGKVDEYVEHFRTTFGGNPNGWPLKSNTPQVETEPELTLGELINTSSVAKVLRKLPRGKAWGSDDIPGEFLTCGEDQLVGPLVAFLTLVAIVECIPSIWREALVVPVWKKKGSPTDIAMHRPISLTCTGRRLYERVLLNDVNRFVDKLCDLQGGFRPHRGTAHQALTLHEAFVRNPNAKVALLDLRAAYDLVDRRRLWSILQVRYGFPQHSIGRLRDLFEGCHSRLQFGEVRSKELANTRGLMQGSSLSPTIFNFFIDELAHELEAGQEGVLVHGRRTPALLFADDTALIGATEEELADLLRVCEKWSIRAGMEFSPTKCVCFVPQPHQRREPLQLYGVDLPSTEKATYLGYPFTRLGVEFAALCKERCDKAKGVIATLQPMGMNVTGWAPAAAAQVYKTFVRPVMEYGLELKEPTSQLLEVYQRTQNLALRTIMSAPHNTSIAALHRLLHIPLMKERCKEINFLGACRFHNSTYLSVRGVVTWRRGVQQQRYKPPGSIPHKVLTSNEWCIEFASQLMDHREHLLTRDKPRVVPPPITSEQRQERQAATIQQLEEGNENIASAVLVRVDMKTHQLYMAETKVCRADRVSISRWQIGLVAGHQVCRNCGDELSRVHAVKCSGAAEGLRALVGNIPVGKRFGRTEIDWVINAHANEMGPEQAKLIVEAISKVERVCRGRERSETGFWS